MRRRLSLAVPLLLFALSPVAQAAPRLPYYLALGDSLAVGEQPSPAGPLVSTNQGYVDDVYGVYRLTHPFLQLAKLGCSGETTATMMTGGVCSYQAGSQLAQAIGFIQTHRVALITLSIGGDDILHCIDPSGTVVAGCVTTGLTAVGLGLPQILIALRAAAGPHVPIVVANYYDPFLAAAVLLPYPGGVILAGQSLDITHLFNSTIEGICNAGGIPVADVARAFRIDNDSNLPIVNIPVNVFLSLTWTWIAAPPPRGPDVHPNAVGYLAIAGAFVRAIGAL
jgi:lysophospholipase L1-like esterase